MNNNNQISLSGDSRKPQYRLSLKKVCYDVQSGTSRGYVELSGDSAAAAGPNTLVTLSGASVMDFHGTTEPFTIPVGNTADPTNNGNVYIQTVGFTAADGAYTIILDFRKNPSDYSAGYQLDPRGFSNP